MIPRLDCLGLIEALAAGFSCRSSASIPRLDCLGLIEAALLRSFEHSFQDSEA